ncbi:signal peptidase I [Patescibacteria group bacterium]|nr:signal peptidase I [Patescibacteria group bacterium]
MSTKTGFSIVRSLRYLHALLGWLATLFVIAIGVNSFVLTTYTVDGHSMEPTLKNGEHLGVSLLTYDLFRPQLGDVVIVTYAGDPTVHFVKRIEGIPGDMVQYQGEPLPLGPSQYFVVGDNRDHSTDSRVFGPVNRSQILGKVVFPFSLKNGDPGPPSQ